MLSRGSFLIRHCEISWAVEAGSSSKATLRLIGSSRTRSTSIVSSNARSEVERADGIRWLRSWCRTHPASSFRIRRLGLLAQVPRPEDPGNAKQQPKEEATHEHQGP